MRHEPVYMRSDDALIAFLAERLGGVFARGDRVAIKLHMGEPGNKYFIAAPFAKRVVDCVASLGAKPFIFDSPVMYSSPRNDERRYLAAAAAHGYSKKELGCPVVVSNAGSSVKGSHMTYRICKDLLKADGVLLLTHVKGHVACGMGGAIKNVGMGCVAKETKGAIHEGGEPIYSEGCTRASASPGARAAATASSSVRRSASGRASRHSTSFSPNRPRPRTGDSRRAIP
jgi:uncharacterized Fe-S center protein